MFCLMCGKEIKPLTQKCPYCGRVQFETPPPEIMAAAKSLLSVSVVKQSAPPKKKKRKSRFSEADCYFMGIHPNDKTWKDLMRLDLLTDDSAWER